MTQTSNGWQSRFIPGLVTPGVADPTFELVPFVHHSGNPDITNYPGTWAFTSNREIAITFGGETITFAAAAPGISIGVVTGTKTETNSIVTAVASTTLYIAVRKQ